MKTIFLEKSLGLDIREESVAITLLGKTMRKVQVIDWDFFRIPSLSQDRENSETIFIEKINQFLMQNDSWPENLVVSLPRAHFSFQSFELPAPDLKTARSMIGFELERHFSSNLDNFCLGSHTSKAGDNLFHVMSTAVKKETLNYYLELLGRLNLKPSIVDVSSFANVNLVLSQSKEMPPLSAVIDVGPQGIELSLLKNRHIDFSKYATLNDPDFKHGFFQDNLEASYYETIAKGLAKIIVEELQNTLESCRNIDDSESIEIIYLLGAGPYSAFLTESLQKETEVSTTRVRIPSAVQTISAKTLSSAYTTTSLSLGMRALKKCEIEANLLPPERQPKKRKANIKLTIGLAVAALVLLVGLFVNTIVHQNVTLAKLDQQLMDVKKQVGSFQDIDREHEYLEEITETLNAIEQNYPSKLPVLAGLSQALSRDTWLTNIKISQKTMEIRGFSKTASKLVPIIEKSPHFTGTKFVGAIVNQKEGEKFTIQTELQASP
jgi:Tfp pilus assembly PilM family ATPase/Tfp pilus assembly protein PilN